MPNHVHRPDVIVYSILSLLHTHSLRLRWFFVFTTIICIYVNKKYPGYISIATKICFKLAPSVILCCKSGVYDFHVQGIICIAYNWTNFEIIAQIYMFCFGSLEKRSNNEPIVCGYVVWLHDVYKKNDRMRYFSTLIIYNQTRLIIIGVNTHKNAMSDCLWTALNAQWQ